MGLPLFFALAAVVMFSAVIAAIVIHIRKGRSQFITPMNALFVGIAVSGVLLYGPIYYAQQPEGAFRIFKTLMLSAYSAMRLFMGEGDYSVVLEEIGALEISSYYLILPVILQVVAPILTISAIISFFLNMSSWVRYLSCYFRDVYIFSALNESSLMLARDLKKNHPRAAVVFADNFHSGDEEPRELQGEASALGAILFEKDLLDINFAIHASDRSLWFFAIHEEESRNVSDGLQIIERYGAREQTNLYVFSSSLESEVLFSAFRDTRIKLRRVNPVRSLIYRNLYDEGIELFRSALPRPDGTKQITAVVVGLGDYGTNMVKALVWACQVDGYRLQIHAFDADPLAEDRFAAQCPELMSQAYNGVSLPGEAEYTIRIHSGIHVETKTFADAILALPETTFVLTALSSDEQNIETAIHLRMLFERCGAKPVIRAIVHNSEKKDALQDLRNFRQQPYRIGCIGDLESSCTEDVVIDSEMEADALRRHLRYGKEADFWAYEYNYRSSIALAVAAKLRRDLGFPPEAADLTEEERNAIESMEHRRWNAYMRSEGYIFSGSTEKASRNDLAKMHNDLTDYYSLAEEEKRKDSVVGLN